MRSSIFRWSWVIQSTAIMRTHPIMPIMTSRRRSVHQGGRARTLTSAGEFSSNSKEEIGWSKI